jgi:hypothetical protein
MHTDLAAAFRRMGRPSGGDLATVVPRHGGAQVEPTAGPRDAVCACEEFA